VHGSAVEVVRNDRVDIQQIELVLISRICVENAMLPETTIRVAAAWSPAGSPVITAMTVGARHRTNIRSVETALWKAWRRSCYQKL
jgi:hypothetical protein